MKSPLSFLLSPRLYRPCLCVAFAFGAAEPAWSQDEKVDFEKQVWPFLERSCVKCHKAPHEENGRTVKPKAGLRMDGAWAIKLGSENGSVMTPGNAKDSEIWWRTDLPDDDDDFMPPSGKADPLSAEEKELFKKWIDEGADFGEWVGSLEGKPKEISNSGDKIPVSEIQELYKSLSEGLEVPKEDAWKEVTAAGGRVMPLATDSPLLSVDFRLVREEADDAKIATIGAISDHVAQLDLSKTSVTDAGLAPVGELSRLVKLNLSETGITDAGLTSLKGLDHLTYLNLYGTNVGDAGLKQLANLKQLENIYLWQSKATDQGVKALQKALPDAHIVWK
ncbi:MAG: hypothetical protein KDN19_11545 [Verrucomicrobiae bacterium]|nr:hypothetical protein [Verrucomicrobiae bacterium]